VCVHWHIIWNTGKGVLGQTKYLCHPNVPGHAVFIVLVGPLLRTIATGHKINEDTHTHTHTHTTAEARSWCLLQDLGRGRYVKGSKIRSSKISKVAKLCQGPGEPHHAGDGL